MKPEARDLGIDLHAGLDRLLDDDFETVCARTHELPFGGMSVRVLAPEDHLRILCLHLLQHGAWRPLWLCDVAIAVEARPPDFNWDRCLGSNRRRADWVACGIGLASELLGARVADTPVERRAASLPRWLVRRVQKQWNVPVSKRRGSSKHRAPMASYLGNPVRALMDLHTRWPDPIAATLSLGGPLNDWPRVFFQIANCILRAEKFFRTELRSAAARCNEPAYDKLAADKN